MIGTTKVGISRNPNIGNTEVKIDGDRSMITDIKISINNESGGIEIFGKGAATKIKTSCDINNPMDTVEFYKFKKKALNRSTSNQHLAGVQVMLAGLICMSCMT